MFIYLGFQLFIWAIMLSVDIELNVEFMFFFVVLQEVVVMDKAVNEFVKQVVMSCIVLFIEDIKKMFFFMGELDVIKII